MYNIKKLTSIRLIKDKKQFTGMPKVNVMADFPINLIDDIKYFYETEGEYVLYLEHPPLDDVIVADLEICLSEDINIDKVLIEKEYYYFKQVDNILYLSITFDNLPLKTSTLSVHTLIREKGQTMRIEHNQSNRYVGFYETYPDLQIKAVLHYMFACWEILRLSEASYNVSNDKVGHYAILGFETNNALHPDFPPHWHLILRWPYRVGSQAPHIYVNEDGKNIYNESSIDGIPKFRARYDAEEWMDLVDMYGEKRLAIKVDSDGGYTLRINKQDYKVSAYTNDSVDIYINENPLVKVTVEDNSEEGVITAAFIYLSTTKTLSLSYDKYTGEIINIDEWSD